MILQGEVRFCNNPLPLRHACSSAPESESPAVGLCIESVPLVLQGICESHSLVVLPVHLTDFPGTRGRHYPGPCLPRAGHWPTAGSAGADFAQGRHRAPGTANKGINWKFKPLGQCHKPKMLNSCHLYGKNCDRKRVHPQAQIQK